MFPGSDNERVSWLRWLRMRRFLRRFSLLGLIRSALLLTLIWWIAQNWYGDLDRETLRARYALDGSRFVTVGGVETHVREMGAGEPLLLIHDAGSTLHTWDYWTRDLSDAYRVISVDLPGYGLTGPHPKGSYSDFMYAGFIGELARELGLSNFALAGNGIGARIAWFYAHENPQQLSKLILIDSPGFEKSRSDLIAWLARTPVINRIFLKITPRYFVRLALEDAFANDSLVTPERIALSHELMRHPGNRKAFTDRAQVSDNHPPIDLIDEIKTPTLILWGAEDTRYSPEHAYEFHRRIRGSLLRIYQNTGRWPQEESPEETARDVKAFLEGRF